jgi:hypothetical protein
MLRKHIDKTLFSLPSSEIDHYFGLAVNEIEAKLYYQAKVLRPNGNLSNLGQVLHDGHQTWVGLEPQTLLTPYNELVLICKLLNPLPNEHLIDLGAGYGRMGLVMNTYAPESFFTGYELVAERVNEGNRVFQQLNYLNGQLYSQDLTDPNFKIPKANYYFLYDYGKVAHIRETLKELEDMAMEHRFKVVARGKGSRSIIEHEHPWLSQINPVHREETFSIYSF